MAKITIIDYGVGNFRNVQKAFQFVGATAEITDSIDVVNQAKILVLPGVGAFGDAMDNLRVRHLDTPVLNAVKAGKPLLGICVGLQLLFEKSEEMGHHTGLGILPGKIARFPEGQNLTIPHMGWNQIETQQKHPIMAEIDEGDFAYFAHSYHAVPTNTADIIAQTEYGTYIPSVVGRNNVCAIQFHPEKSQQVGLQILKNFVTFAGGI
ncbi:imidazole glycerol phosphate synthase subunit HisH [Anaerolineales bacterium HSG6]|nr:imidazole glycerol phosphate synthase subunit HisH [Anaerolineales bacterium HSG6]